jgi:hypothetical protein
MNTKSRELAYSLKLFFLTLALFLLLAFLLDWDQFLRRRSGKDSSRIETVRNKPQGHNDVGLFGSIQDTFAQRRIQKQMVERRCDKGREHWWGETILDGVETLVERKKGSTTSSNGTAENGSKQGKFEFTWWNSVSSRTGQLDDNRGTHRLIQENDCRLTKTTITEMVSEQIEGEPTVELTGDFDNKWVSIP